MPQSADSYRFWATSINDIYRQFSTSDQGLSDNNAKVRLARNGPNTLATDNHEHLALTFLKQFANPLVLLLLFASVISAVTGELANFLIIVSIILISAILDFFQQYKAKIAIEKLRERVSLISTVLRDGKQIQLPAAQLVEGDVIVLEAGNIVPADARLLTAKDLLVDESALTGESNPVEKDALITAPDNAILSQRINCVFMATHIISGNATAIITAAGTNSQYGAIAKSLAQKQPEHAFEHGLKHFGYLIMKFTLVLVVIVFFVIILRHPTLNHHDIVQVFIFALALAVGLTPELLPIILTLNLSRGALRMAQKGVIVKHLPAIQDFGSMQILCTDKTGTLTENRIELERYEDITEKETARVFSYAYINSHFLSSLKTPLEKAILRHEHLTIELYRKVDEIPFDFARRASSVIVQHSARTVLITKGALDRILPLATHYDINGKAFAMTTKDHKRITSRFEQLSKEGYRVLALAKRECRVKDHFDVADETNLTFLGLLAFLDPPKKSAQQALARLAAQGIQIKIITGDNELVTTKICQDLGLAISGTLTGDRIDNLNDAALETLAKHTTIFAKISPSQKQRIIVLLKRSGAVVGYLGDGINDAPSLRAADIGISVNNAVDIAKETASLILLHNDLHVLNEGVVEGRKTYANIMKYIMMGASSNFGNMFSVAGASLFLPFLPMLPVQILLNNLLYDISELAIPTDNVDAENIQIPRQWDVNFIKKFMLVFGPISSIFDFLTFFVLLVLLHVTESSFQTGWFVESLVSQAIIILAIRTARFPFMKSRPSLPLLLSTVGLIIIALLMPFLPFAALFSFKPLPWQFFFALSGIILGYVSVVEIAKRWFYQRMLKAHS